MGHSIQHSNSTSGYVADGAGCVPNEQPLGYSTQPKTAVVVPQTLTAFTHYGFDSLPNIATFEQRTLYDINYSRIRHTERDNGELIVSYGNDVRC